MNAQNLVAGARRKARILRALLAIKLTQKTADPVSFWTAFFVDSTVFFVQAAVFAAIYGNVDRIGGWDAARSLFFVGIFTLIDALAMSVFCFGLFKLPEEILTGKLDLYATKPGGTLLHAAFNAADPGSLLILFPAFAILSTAASGLGIPADPGRIAATAAAVVLMTVLFFCLMVIVRTSAFWLSRAGSLAAAEGALTEFGFRVPGSAWKGPVRVVFRRVLPYGLLAAFPSEVYFGEAGAAGWLGAVLTVAAFGALAALLWRAGLRRYAGAGS